MANEDVVLVGLRRSAEDHAIYGSFDWDGQTLIYTAYDRYPLSEHITLHGSVRKICDASMQELRVLRPPVETLLLRAFERLRDETKRHQRIAQPILDEITRLEYEREQSRDLPERSAG